MGVVIILQFPFTCAKTNISMKNRIIMITTMNGNNTNTHAKDFHPIIHK